MEFKSIVMNGCKKIEVKMENFTRELTHTKIGIWCIVKS